MKEDKIAINAIRDGYLIVQNMINMMNNKPLESRKGFDVPFKFSRTLFCLGPDYGIYVIPTRFHILTRLGLVKHVLGSLPAQYKEDYRVYVLSLLKNSPFKSANASFFKELLGEAPKLGDLKQKAPEEYTKQNLLLNVLSNIRRSISISSMRSTSSAKNGGDFNEKTDDYQGH
jgi:hypothetical protein